MINNNFGVFNIDNSGDFMILPANDPVANFMRITHAAKPYFALFSRKPVGLVQERYPETAEKLFRLALKIVDGEYGEKLREEEMPVAMEGLTYPTETVIGMLREEVRQTSERTEIFDENLALKKISDIDIEGLAQLFHEYLANLMTPSHLTVELLLDKGLEDRALDVALSLRHPYEKGRALVDVIANKLQQKKADEAEELFGLIPQEYEKRAVATKILGHYLNEGDLESAIAFGEDLEELREHTLPVIAVWMVTHQRLDRAIALVNDWAKGSNKDYVLSLIVNALAGKNDFEEAKAVVWTIKDRGYRQDAFDAIVKKLVNLRKLKEAQAFVNSLDNVDSRQQSNRIIESAVASFEQDRRIQQLYPWVGP